MSAGIALAGLLPSGCASLDKPGFVRSGAQPVTSLPGWSQESATGLRKAIAAQCRVAALAPPWPRLCATLEQIPTSEAAATTATVKARTSHGPLSAARLAHHASLASDDYLKQWIRQHFDAWQLINRLGAGDGLLTGYYEPLLTGSLTRENPDQVALYARPADLIAADPMFTRGQIETGQSDQRLSGLQLLWLDDPIEAFFLHIQGSGKVRLRDGRIVRAGFAGHNGHPYVAIGAELISKGKIRRADMTADAIKQWIRANPVAGRELMHSNPRFIFFKLDFSQPDGVGPAGSMQVPLTSLRSVATDKRYLPAGSLLYLDSHLPASRKRAGAGDTNRNVANHDRDEGKSLVGLTLTQDTGSAIRGAVRADLFTGSGQLAGQLAGQMKQPARIWLLWPKGKVPPATIPVARPVINP
ncbi:MAG: MltA domain-containing protein [Burkholderiaceae bacterium]